MENKANFLKVRINVNSILKRDYEKKSNRTFGENKAKQSQFRIGRLMTDHSLSDEDSTVEVLSLECTIGHYGKIFAG